VINEAKSSDQFSDGSTAIGRERANGLDLSQRRNIRGGTVEIIDQ
jgi:hypothetical protein